MPGISALPISARNRSSCSAAAFTACCSPIKSKPFSRARRIMDERTHQVRQQQPPRPEREFLPETTGTIGDVARPLTPLERLTNMRLGRRLAVVIVLAVAWEIYARFLD